MHLAASTAITAGNTVPFDTIDYDPNGNLTTGASALYTVPINGIYLITWAVRANASVSFTTQVSLTGSVTGPVATGSWATNNVSAGSVQQSCTAADTIKLITAITNMTSNASVAPLADTFMAIHFMSPT